MKHIGNIRSDSSGARLDAACSIIYSVECVGNLVFISPGSSEILLSSFLPDFIAALWSEREQVVPTEREKNDEQEV